MIYISNSFYLASLGVDDHPNRPLIGWHSVFDVDQVSADSYGSQSSYPARNVWSGDTYSRWRSPVNNTQNAVQSGAGLLFSGFQSEQIDYAGIAGHNFADFGIGYQWQRRNASNQWEAITTLRVPADNKPIVHYFDPVQSNQFRLRVVIPSGLDAFAEVAHVKLGRILRLARPRYVGDIPGGMDIKVQKISSKSYSGNHLGSVLISEGQGFSIVQENNPPQFIRNANLQNFFKHAYQLIRVAAGPAETFFYAWRPHDYPRELQYCGQVTNFNPPTNQRSNGMMNWSMSGEAFQ